MVTVHISTNLSYKSFYLLPIHIRLHKSICAFHLSYCKFDYNHHCFLHRMDVLKIDNY